MRIKLVAALLGAALALSSTAFAATVRQTFAFTADSFEAYSGSLPAPHDPVTGVFRVTFDPNLDMGPTVVGLEVLSLSIDNPGAAFVYQVVGDGVMDIGTKPNVVGGFTINAPGDFGLSIFNLRNNPRFGYFQYATDDGNYYSLIGSLTASVPALVPEPRTWLLMIAGFALAGGALRLGGRRVARA